MKSIFAPVIALALAASTAFAQFTINTPSSAVECEPLLITWVGGLPTFCISPGTQPNLPATITFNQTSATSLTWLVNQASGSVLDLNIRDNNGTLAQSAPFTIGAGPDTSCLAANATVSASFGSTAANAPTSTGTSGSSPATTATGSSGSGPAKTSAGSSTASSASTKSAGASRVTGQFAAAGIIGAAMVALLG